MFLGEAHQSAMTHFKLQLPAHAWWKGCRCAGAAREMETSKKLPSEGSCGELELACAWIKEKVFVFCGTACFSLL